MIRGWWYLSFNNVTNDDIFKLNDADREHIAEMIKEGCLQGELIHEEEEKEK